MNFSQQVLLARLAGKVVSAHLQNARGPVHEETSCERNERLVWRYESDIEEEFRRRYPLRLMLLGVCTFLKTWWWPFFPCTILSLILGPMGMAMLRDWFAGPETEPFWNGLNVFAILCVLFALGDVILLFGHRPLRRVLARSIEVNANTVVAAVDERWERERLWSK